MTGEISVLALRCPCCMLNPDSGVNDEKLHCIGAFIPFWKGRKRFRVIFLGDTFQ